MWSRLLRLFAAGANAYYNPFQFLLGLVMVFITPYLIYLFWGSIILMVLLGAGLFLGIRFIAKRIRQHPSI